jgi:amidase
MVQGGSVQPQDLINESYARAAALEPELHAFTYLPPQSPTAAVGNGPLAGIAVGVKDLVDTADMPTTYGSRIYADHQPSEDAWIAARLKDLSATILGKTVTTEFAWRHPGPTRNPWNRNHTPGGSSSGSAASVASGSVQLALGTQTLGSILRPAAFCGIVGLKPSFGTISLKGVRAFSQSLDQLGVFARSVDDVGYALSLLMGGPGAARHAPFQVSPDGLAPFPAPRIAFCGLSHPLPWRRAKAHCSRAPPNASLKPVPLWNRLRCRPNSMRCRRLLQQFITRKAPQTSATLSQDIPIKQVTT